jgi:hypothetical protein
LLGVAETSCVVRSPPLPHPLFVSPCGDCSGCKRLGKLSLLGCGREVGWVGAFVSGAVPTLAVSDVRPGRPVAPLPPPIARSPVGRSTSVA